ncbi:TPA: hypothetical protein L5597_002196 [Pseudomonas aeruginosa]|nr:MULTISPECIES: hypothetical protein [Pseudomonas]AXL82871.1 hypothetical protein Y89_2352 [Pseudomonas aeruginosa]AXO28309.1 hypothetical protein Ysp71_2356 [Pseudomonas aeruginosa]ELV5905977.1 hypothetical protein [Pseudomonas aeruginosa]ERU45240.1 hypothetical protein Q093_00454 [Pseudomonas aeruginosa CF614]ERV55772.1 hypothetical protein Q065_02462 [Pseudomonas aeruginosa BL11]
MEKTKNTLSGDFKNLFIIKSIYTFFKKNRIDQDYRATLFQEGITPKVVFSFIFFIIILGQIGILTSIITSTISGQGFLKAIAAQGESGNFLTFEISLIFSCAMLYFNEYSQDEKIDLLFLRVTYLIAGLVIAFLAMLNYIYITTTNNVEWTSYFIVYNIFLYVFGIYISYKMHLTFSAAEESAAKHESKNTADTQKRAITLQSVESAKIGGSEIKL